MKKIRAVGYILWCCIWLQACNVTSDQPEVVVGIESDFKAELSEKVRGDSRELFLKLQSIEEVACESAYLNFRTQEDPSSIHIELLGFNQPFGCDLSVLNFVESEINLIKNLPRTYSLNIQLLNSFENNGSLAIHDDRYELTLENNKGFQVQFKTLMKTDHKLFWGYLATDDSSLNLDEMRSDLIVEIDDRVDYSNLATGTYTDFYIGDDGTINMRGAIEYDRIKPFYFKPTEETREDLIAIIQSYKTMLPAGVEMNVFTGRGEVF